MHTITWCRVGVSSSTSSAVKSLGVPNPVGFSQSMPTSWRAATASSSASRLKSGSSHALATNRDPAARLELFDVLGVAPVVLGGEQPLFDRKLAQRDFEYLKVSDLLDHRAASASGISGRVVPLLQMTSPDTA